MTQSISPDSHEARSLYEIVRNPVTFSRGVLNQRLWPVQADILTALTRCRRVYVKACHSSGKSFTAAAATLWWITHHHDGIVITTAPTWTQVKRVLWKEIHRALRASRLRYPVEAGQTQLNLSAENYAIGLSTNEGVNFQGFHGKVLIIMDEAPGVQTDIQEAIEGVRAGGDVRVLALGNPVIASGPFYDAFTSQRSLPDTETFTISAFDTPNLYGLTLDSLLAMTPDELQHNQWPMLTLRSWVYEKYHEWGVDHPSWQSRVMGEFPAQAEDALISLAWLEQAKMRTIPHELKLGLPDVVGIDVAGPGEDETVVCHRRGPVVMSMRGWPDADPRGAVEAYLQSLPVRKESVKLNVDSCGTGYYFGKHFQDRGWRVEYVNVGESPRDSERFANLKGEYYWGLRERIKAGDFAFKIKTPVTERAIGELASIRYKHNSRGQVVIESKEELRKRGRKSPDYAEAVMLAFGESGPKSMPGPLVSLASESYYSRV